MFGGLPTGFDLSDAEPERERREAHERELRKVRRIASRAFAQGFTAALEDGNASDWIHYYGERADDEDTMPGM